MAEDLEELYQAIILDHNRRPQNFGPLKDADVSARGYNASCGDDLTLQIKMDGPIIEDVRFSGEGCAISRASASLLTGIVKGKSQQEVEVLAQKVISSLSGGPDSLVSMGDLCALEGVKKFPMRIKCATLAWHSLLEALTKINSRDVE